MTESPRTRVLAVTGPTAGGKSDLAMALAELMPVEIVCMDSMQIYAGMDIGTAKPTRDERARVPHHMLDIRKPQEEYSVAEYVRDAGECIAGITSRGHVPVLVGGTGLYLRAMRTPMTLGSSAKDVTVRAHYQQILDTEGAVHLHALLAQRDPDAARQLHPNNTRRVIRALEVLELTGQPFSAQRMPETGESPYRMMVFGTAWPREALYQRIDMRVQRMVTVGLVDEVRALLDGGVPEMAQAMQGLGYKEMIPFLRGETTLTDTIEHIARRTRNYAKRQMAWFNREPDITWLSMNAGTLTEHAAAIAARWEQE